MADLASELILLMPERRRFRGQPVSAAVGKVLGRADVLAAEEGERAQLSRYVDILPRGWPMAAMCRQLESRDAGAHAWLRADPVHVRPDINGARLMAWGNLGLSEEEAESFLQPLRPMFGDMGLPISNTAPERWYLTLPRESPIPAFTLPAEGLGEDLLAHLPEGPEGARWRVLMNEAQVILHNHPRNVDRVRLGRLPVNSLWFWGGGVLPSSVRCAAVTVISRDVELLALASLAGASAQPQHAGSTLIDLRDHRDWAVLEAGPLGEAIGGWKRRYGSLRMDFSDGNGFRIAAGQQWRLLRRPRVRLEA